MTLYDRDGIEMTAADVDAAPPSLSRAARRSERSAGYGGLRVDEYGYDSDGGYWPALDGGGQDE